MRISPFLQIPIGTQPLESRRLQRQALTPAGNMKGRWLDSEDGTKVGRRCVEIGNHDGFNIGRQFRWIDRSEHFSLDHRCINAAGSNSGRIPTATSDGYALWLLLGAAVVGSSILREITQTCQGWSRRDGEDQRRCDLEFGLARHTNPYDRIYSSLGL